MINANEAKNLVHEFDEKILSAIENKIIEYTKNGKTKMYFQTNLSEISKERIVKELKNLGFEAKSCSSSIFICW